MSFLLKMLSESSEVSTMRVMSLLALIIGSGIAIYGVYKGNDLSGIAQICAIFVGAAFTGKAAQKYMEK